MRANADRLAKKGLLVALESFPWSALANTRIAIDLLRRAGAPNAGLLIDVWHFYNGGGHPDQLVDLPSAGIAVSNSTTARWYTRTSCSMPGRNANYPVRANWTSWG